jgi:hypothetical protein
MKPLQILTALITLTIVFSSCKDYGKKATKGPIEVYYKDGVTEAEAQKTADLFAYIDSSQNNNTKETKSIQLTKSADTICFRMVASKEKLATVNDFAFEVIGNMFADSVFSGKPVNVELTDNTFNTFKKIHFKKLDLNNLGQ